MKLPLLIARRYLSSKKSLSVINTTATISSVAIGVAVAAMVLLLSVQNGFRRVSELLYDQTEPDIVVAPAEGKFFLVDTPEWAQTLAEVESTDGVVAATLQLRESVMVEYGGRRMFAELCGVQDDYLSVVPIGQEPMMWYGQWQLKRGDYRNAVVGRSVDEVFGDGYSVKNPQLHSRLTIYALRRESFSPLLPVGALKTTSVRHAGSLSDGATAQSQCIFVAMDVAQEVLTAEGRATELIVRVAEGQSVERVKGRVEAVVGDEFRVQSRYELNGAYVVMRYEKWAIFFILLLVTIIAAVSIVGSVVMLIIEKRNDIATLYAIGARHRLVSRAFTLEGVLIGLRGVVGGVVAGVAICLAQIHFGIVKMPGTTFLVENYPVEMKLADIVLIALAVVAVCYVITRITVGRMVPKTTKPDETRKH